MLAHLFSEVNNVLSNNYLVMVKKNTKKKNGITSANIRLGYVKLNQLNWSHRNCIKLYT